jgi:predicted phosphohydrolase
MRIVAVADTHTFEADLGAIPDGDVLIHAGDLLRAGTLEELAPVARWIRALPHAHKIVIAGNHDWCFIRHRAQALDMLGDGVRYLEDEGMTLNGLRFWGSPWQPAFHDWAFNLPRGEALAQKWALIPDDTDILITHGPPLGFGDQVIVAGRQGCEELRAALQRVRPALHMFGHIHHDGGLWRHECMTLTNVTTWECERPPTVLDIDPRSLRVTAVHVPPARTIELTPIAAPPRRRVP